MMRSWLVFGLLLNLMVGCSQDEASLASPSADAIIDVALPMDSRVAPDQSVLDVGVIVDDGALADSGLQVDGALIADAVAMADAGQTPCEPALEITSLQTAARPFDLVRLQPSGGTGQWRFSLTENESGALLNETTGAYLAGDIVGSTDTITLTDENCLGQAEFQVRVVETMLVRPGAGEIEIGQSFQFEVEGGSGAFEFEMLSSISGGDVSIDGQFVAGNVQGRDTIRVTDLQTRQTRTVTLRVVRSVTLIPHPPTVFVPVGSNMPLVIDGGTGEFNVRSSGPGVVVENGQIRGLSAGRYDLVVSDRFTGRETSMVVHVVESMLAELAPFDDSRVAMRTVSPGDLNGDGLADLVLAHESADIDAGNSGGVFVYHTTPEGLGPDPVQVFSGTSAEDEFGRGIAFGDLNGDGLTDMVIGARLADPGFNNAGSLFIHLGQPDGSFDPAPADVLSGVRGSDYLGYSVTICDFNGDGRQDIAGGAIGYEDRSGDVVQSGQGGALIFLGYEDGFLDEPDQIVLGMRLEGNGSWSNYRDLQLGSDMVSGDMDGDERCDLAVGANRYNVNGQGNAGAVFIFKGRGPDAQGPGGVTNRASELILADVTADNGGSFGRRLHMADINLDGLSDLVVSENGGDTGGRDRGAAYVFLGSEFDEDEATSPRSVGTADGAYYGDSNYDNDGIGITVGDVTGDGIPDLIVGAYVDDPPGAANAGTVNVYAGRMDGAPIAEFAREIRGPIADMRIGEAVAVIGDVNGDGLNDIVTHANRDSSEFLHSGRTFVVSQEPGIPDPKGEVNEGEDPPLVDQFIPINMPRQVGGGRYGTGVSLVGDVTGDGLEDAVVMAPYVTMTARRSGGVWLHRGLPEGGLSRQGEFIGGFPNHADSDLAWAVHPAGDFDGDGHNDFAILLRDDERPTYNSMTVAPWSAAPAACRGSADCTDGRSCADGGCRGCENDASCPGGQVCVGGDCKMPGQCAPRSYNTGGVYVYRGGPDIFNGTPSFAHWGSRGGVSPEVISGNFDFNGDGFDDLVIGAYRVDNDAGNDAGAAYVIAGRAFGAPEGQIEVMCDTLFEYQGSQAGGNTGRGITAMGDVNGDGCDEFAVGSRAEDRPDVRDEGAVRILYGYGRPGCPPGPRMVRLATGERFSQAGWSLASGDLDGDEIPDLAVGIWQRRTENIPVGGVWVVPGDRLRSLPLKSIPVADSEEPVLLNQWGSEWLIEGQRRDGQTGYRVAIVDSYLAVGTPRDESGGNALVGMVRVYSVSSDGIDPNPIAALVGETDNTGSEAGSALSGGRLNGGPTFLVGAPFGEGSGLDNGSVYLLPLMNGN